MEDITKDYLIALGVLFLVNALVGIALLEWAWYKSRRFRQPIHELTEKFPWWSRPDAPKWKKWKLYPGAATFLVPRLALLVLTTFLTLILINVLLIGHNRNDPITGFREKLCRNYLKGAMYLLAIGVWFTKVSHTYVQPEDVGHYEEYLGPIEEQQRYQEDDVPLHPNVPKRGHGPVSTIVTNHHGVVEILNLICSPLFPSFAPKGALKKVPLLRGLMDA